jgi:hypothetical protein
MRVQPWWLPRCRVHWTQIGEQSIGKGAWGLLWKILGRDAPRL